MAAQYISLKVIGDRLNMNPLMGNLGYDAIVRYTVDFMDIVGVPNMFVEKPYKEKIVRYRAPLPCDFGEEIQILINGQPARVATDTFHTQYYCFEHKSSVCGCRKQHGLNKPIDPTYQIQAGWITTSIDSGKIAMVYRAILTDEEGYPMIPSNSPFLNALEWYIKYKYYTILWENGKLEDKRLENTKQEYAWAVGQCETDMKMMSLGNAETFYNMFMTLLPRTNEFNKRFVHTGTKEYIKRHP